MRISSCTLKLIAVVLAFVLLAAAVTYPRLKQFWQQPLGPSLGLDPTQPVSSPTLNAVLVSEDASTPDAEPTAVPLCGGPPDLTVLAVGTDSRVDNYFYGLADVIRIIQVDFTIPRVAVLTFPRDLWVEIPDISDHYDITHGKLNQAFFYGTPGMGYFDGPGEGAGLLARTLDLNFDLPVDHYGVVNMRTFEDIVDAVGGIDVYLPEAVDGNANIDSAKDRMGYYPQGWNHLTGEKAAKFSRIRKVDSVFARSSRQSQVLCGLKDQLLSPAAITGIPDMISAFNDRVLTDLSPQQIGQLACVAPKLTRENLVFASFPQELMVAGRVFDPQLGNTTFVWDVDFNILRDFVSQFLAGEWPTDDTDGPSCPDTSEFEKPE